MIYYQPNYKDANFILATTDEPRAMWFVGDKAPTVKPTALLGSIEWTYAILDSIGVERPRVIGYETFPLMRKYFKRGIGTTFAGLIPESRFPLFIKPAKELKLFVASIFESKGSMLALIEPNCEVDYSEPVELTDEIRTFWRRGTDGQWIFDTAVAYPQINDEPDLRSYQCLGDVRPCIFAPCPTMVIDIGTMNGVEAIVEIGDMFAMGTYGADAAYLRCHKQWCRELLK